MMVTGCCYHKTFQQPEIAFSSCEQKQKRPFLVVLKTILFIMVNKTRVSLMKPVYFRIVCAAVAYPNKEAITKLRIKKGVH